MFALIDSRRSDFAFAFSAFRISGLLSSFWICHSFFAFIWISCSEFVYITFGSVEVQKFKLHLLHIKRSNFTFIWIGCSGFICITFSSIAIQTFRCCLLQIKRSEFLFIWIRCLDIICINFAPQFRHSDFVFFQSCI